MATINAVILPAKVLKDGRHKIRISVAHNGETRYIPTSLTIDSSKEFKNGSIVRRPDATIMNTKLRGILQRYQDEIDDLAYANGLSCAELVYHLKNYSFNRQMSLGRIFKEYIETVDVKDSTAKAYTLCWKSLSRYLDTEMIASKVTYSIILNLDRAFRKEGLKSGTIRCYMALFKAVLSYALRCGYVEFKVNPFNGYKFPQTEIRQSWLTAKELQQVRDLKTTKRNIIKCRDLFMLSYYLGGINMVDLININFNEQSETLCYARSKSDRRKKSNQFVKFEIPAEAKEIIRKYKRDDGYLALTETDRKTRCHTFFLTNMPKLAQLVGVKKIIYYSARKSFAQHAFDLGISTSVIDYILGHSLKQGGSSLYHYIYVTPEMASEAIRKVLDNLK